MAVIRSDKMWQICSILRLVMVCFEEEERRAGRCAEGNMLTRVTGCVLTARLRLLFKLGPLKLQKLESGYAQDSGLTKFNPRVLSRFLV